MQILKAPLPRCFFAACFAVEMEVIMIKLIAIDLDDTLLDNARAVSPARAAAAIRAVTAQGVRVTLATGRMHRSALPYAMSLNLDIPLITYNGALIKYSRSGETLFHRPLDAGLAEKVLKLFQRRGWYIQAYVGDVLYVRDRDAYARRYEEISGMTAVPLGDKIYTIAGPPTKLLAIAEPENIPDLAAELSAAFGEEIYLTVSKPNYLEMMDPAVNKGAALAFLANHFGLDSSEVMAIGDSLNDLDMIKYAGIGIAMHNARDEVKAAADAVTGANDADGVAEAVEKYVLQAAGG